jgi:4-hydroxythreonine-4-phosphate dehydrogenase
VIGSAGKPRPLALSLGDPAGVGPEITVKAWQALRHEGPVFMVVGDYDAVVAAAGVQSGATVRRVGGPDEADAIFRDALPVLDLRLNSPVVAGKPSATYAAAVIRWIETGVGLALSGAVSGLVTAPIAKAPLYEAGFKFPGHTEFLAELTSGAPVDGERGPVMMLTASDLRVALVTIHISLAQAVSRISTDAIVHTGLVTAEALRRDFGISKPQLAMAAMNPHAGESGALGREEIDIINPAAAKLRALGVSCSDARPADTLFHPGARAGYDAVICLYHDQALIPIKTIDFWNGVNVTLGLPIIRTSPDHGVGFDIAGRGLGRPDSLIAAIRLAGDIAAKRDAARRLGR